MITVEYQTLNDLIDQVKVNSLVLNLAKQHTKDAHEIREIEKTIESNNVLIIKAKDTLKTVAKK